MIRVNYIKGQTQRKSKMRVGKNISQVTMKRNKYDETYTTDLELGLYSYVIMFADDTKVILQANQNRLRRLCTAG